MHFLVSYYVIVVQISPSEAQSSKHLFAIFCEGTFPCHWHKVKSCSSQSCLSYTTLWQFYVLKLFVFHLSQHNTFSLHIQFNIIFLHLLSLPIVHFSSDLPSKTLYTLLTMPIQATCPTHCNRIYFITLMMSFDA